MNSHSPFIPQFYAHLNALLFAICLVLPGCVVVPKKTSSYDHACNMNVNKVDLDIALFETNDWLYPYEPWDLSEEVSSATFLFATSAIVSGSIAVAGNAFYHLENKLACVSDEQIKEYTDARSSSSHKILDEYVIEEEIVTAKF